jgi:hypothetical protein
MKPNDLRHEKKSIRFLLSMIYGFFLAFSSIVPSLLNLGRNNTGRETLVRYTSYAFRMHNAETVRGMIFHSDENSSLNVLEYHAGKLTNYLDIGNHGGILFYANPTGKSLAVWSENNGIKQGVYTFYKPYSSFEKAHFDFKLLCGKWENLTGNQAYISESLAKSLFGEEEADSCLGNSFSGNYLGKQQDSDFTVAGVISDKSGNPLLKTTIGSNFVIPCFSTYEAMDAGTKIYFFVFDDRLGNTVLFSYLLDQITNLYHFKINSYANGSFFDESFFDEAISKAKEYSASYITESPFFALFSSSCLMALVSASSWYWVSRNGFDSKIFDVTSISFGLFFTVFLCVFYAMDVCFALGPEKFFFSYYSTSFTLFSFLFAMICLIALSHHTKKTLLVSKISI